MKKVIIVLFISILFVSPIYPTLFAANSEIQGTVKDAQSNEPLFGANIVLQCTGLGAASNEEGSYTIRNVPPGTYNLRVTYIGYSQKDFPINVQEGININQDIELSPVGVEGETVIVTAQAEGQNQAINQQLSASQIMNVVSSARIQELPDANAAESVGRLPGVSILRSGGEGNQVVIRGLQPKYNAILVGGVRMASSDSGNRSSDLSMISPYMLEGIEVTKAVTADQDADVLGGTVNFKMKEAGGGTLERGGLGVNILVQGGYNGLSNAYNKFNNYKYVASVEGRFFESLFGVFVQADLERKNLTSNELGAVYTNRAVSTTEYITTGLNLNYIPRDRQRANATVVLDYRLPEGKINLMNFFSSGTTRVQKRNENFGIVANQHSYSLSFSKSTLNLITNALTFDHQLPVFRSNIKLSHTYSETKNPNDWTVTFLQTSAGLQNFINKANLNPQDIPKAANNNFAQTILSTVINNSSFSKERALTASIDLDKDIALSEQITSVIKFGGKYRYQKRTYDYEHFNNNASFGSTSARVAAQLIASHFPSASKYDPNAIPITAFADPSFSYGDFLDGNYSMAAPLSFGMLSEIAALLQRNAAYITQQQAEGYAKNNLLSTTKDYSGNEDQSAFYVMATINIGPQITFIPGIRYQNLKTTYEAARGIQGSLSYYAYNHYDTTVTQSHGFWLPDFILRYKPFPWFDIRLSYTNTLAYPDYVAIIPRIDVATTSIAWNNYKLVPSRSANYDAYFSFYDNSIGLFTIGGFLKQIEDLIYPWTFYVSGANALPYFPPKITTATPSGNYSISTYVNNKNRIDNWGIEVDWQTHFWYLPKPLDGLVLNINYTHIFSEAEYPFVYRYQRSIRDPVQNIDSSFTDRLLFQPNDIVNISLGYDYKDFSIRFSMLYQADVFTGPNFWPQLRSSTANYTRWDISAKQDLPWFGLQVYGDINNLNEVNDLSKIHAPTNVPQSEQSYGLTANIGIRWQL